MATLNNTIIIATHSLVYGAPQALREYLINHSIKNLLYIAHPLMNNGKSEAEYIQNGKSIDTKTPTISLRTPLFQYFHHMYLTFVWSMSLKNNADVFVGVDPLNAFVGVFLKKFGKTNKLIYYTIDYVPQRFGNHIMNWIYHWLDTFCVKHADETWNVSPRIADARKKQKGLDGVNFSKQKVVPIGIWYDQVKRYPFSKIKKHQLFFIGHLMESAGVQMVLEAIPEIIIQIPDFHFLIVGGGEYEEYLRSLAKKLDINNSVTFTGWVKDRKKLDTIMSDSAAAVALYDPKTTKTTWFSDPTKLKDYLSASLPIILTDVPHNAYDIEKHGCGIVINYTKDEVVYAVLNLLKDETKLEKFRKNALQYVQKYDWNAIFDTHLIPHLS